MLTPTNLLFDNCDTVALAKEYGTPLLMISQSRLEEKSKEIHKDFLDKYNHVQAVYASKAFLNTAMCKLVEKYGMGLDVVSGGELYVAQTANFPMRNIVFHGNNKSYEELSQAVDLQVGRIIVDNPSELRMLEKFVPIKTHVSLFYFALHLKCHPGHMPTSPQPTVTQNLVSPLNKWLMNTLMQAARTSSTPLDFISTSVSAAIQHISSQCA